MVQRVSPLFKKNIIFDFECDAIVCAALRGHIEAAFHRVGHLPMTPCDRAWLEGDLDCGAFLNVSASPSYDVVAWNEVGVVGLAFDAWNGPIQQLGLSIDDVTGGPDDIRAAVPDLPEELEPVFVRAASLLDLGQHDEKSAGIGFWLLRDQAGGTFFTATRRMRGAFALGAWGLLNGTRLMGTCSNEFHDEPDEPEDVPIHQVIDAVLDRRLDGPTELTPAELEILLSRQPEPAKLLSAQRCLQEVGITWPGSPEIPAELPKPKARYRDPFIKDPPISSVHTRNLEYRVFFDRDSIVRAALRAFIESTLAKLDPLDRHPFAAAFTPSWTGNLQQGAFRNTDASGSYEVLAWSDVGLVGLAYENGFGPVEHLELPITDVKGGPDDVRIAVTEMPAELEPTLVIAVDLLDIGEHGEKLASVGCWQHGELVGGSLYQYYRQKGKERLRAWGKLKKGQLRRWYQNSYVLDLGRTKAAPIQALVDALTERALQGPTALTEGEIATLLPSPPDPEKMRNAQRKLAQVGITWLDVPA